MSGATATGTAKSSAMAGFKPRHFLWRSDGAVGIIQLDRPDRKNPLTFESYAELRDTFRALRTAGDIHAVVLLPNGGNFCSGGDVRDIIGPLIDKDMKGLLAFTRMTGDLVKAMLVCGKPIIAAVDGVAVGAGAIIAMAADLRLATPAAQTAFLFNRVGLAGCDMGACAILPRIIGHGRAAELLYTGRTMTAQEGNEWGFYNRLVAADALEAEALTLARRIATGPTFANGITKTQLYQEWAMSLDAAIEAEAQAQAICMQTEDFARAYRAFIAKQKPVFEGN
jgi:enoyl-CoA hydratase/carnithine racemase